MGSFVKRCDELLCIWSKDEELIQSFYSVSVEYTKLQKLLYEDSMEDNKKNNVIIIDLLNEINKLYYIFTILNECKILESLDYSNIVSDDMISKINILFDYFNNSKCIILSDIKKINIENTFSNAFIKKILKKLISDLNYIELFICDIKNNVTKHENNDIYIINKMSYGEKVIFSYCRNYGNRKKRIEFRLGDLTKTTERFDVAVCSAYKGGYVPSKNTLIEALLKNRGISVYNLARFPEIDMKNFGGWLSQKTGDDLFKRIACVELLDYRYIHSQKDTMDTLISSQFTTFRFILERASANGISLKKVVLPILGTGRQKIPKEYIVAPLIKQCIMAFDSIAELEEIVFYEKNEEKLISFVENVKRVAESSNKDQPRVFISYSSKQKQMAHEISGAISKEGISCWIAPESIPSGGDYLEEIPVAISASELVVLVLSKDSIKSPWVQREVSSAIGSQHIIVPYQIEQFELNNQFKFMMNCAQILHAWKKNDNNYQLLVDEVKSKLTL